MARGRTAKTRRRQPNDRRAPKQPVLSVAKILPPESAGPVSRPRLFRQLDRDRTRSLTWISGPAGSGKTSLIASYLRSRAARTIWYRVDETDEDMATLFHYLSLTVPARRRPLPQFTPEYQRGVANFARLYFRALFGRVASPFVLVFDSYQDISANASLHDVVQQAVEELPTHGRIFIISRHEPPAAFARLRASRAIAQVSWSDLRLRGAEAAAIVRALTGQRWPRAVVDSVHATVDGWAAGLILFLERYERTGAPAPRGAYAPAAESASAVFDYFASEVFARADRDTQEILLRTALVPNVTVPIAVALSGRPSAGDVLDRLYRQHYFTTRQEHAEPVYQYHPLFREFLRARARRLLPADELRALQRSAARLIEDEGDADAAVALLKEAGDWSGFVALIGRQAMTLLSQGRSVTSRTGWSRCPTGSPANTRGCCIGAACAGLPGITPNVSAISRPHSICSAASRRPRGCSWRGRP